MFEIQLDPARTIGGVVLTYKNENGTTNFQPDNPQHILTMDYEDKKMLEFAVYDGEFSMYWGADHIHWIHSFHGGERGHLSHSIKATPKS